MVTSERIRQLNDVESGRGPVVYWCTSARRMHSNFALQFAVEQAEGRGLIIVEALRDRYPFSSPRFHQFVADGMRDNAAACAVAGIPYYGLIGENDELLGDLAKFAGHIVADYHPGFFFPQMLAAAAKLDVAVTAVDGATILPLAAGKQFTTAAAFRRYLQNRLPAYLADFPATNSLENAEPSTVESWFKSKYESNFMDEFAEGPEFDVAPVNVRGGPATALELLDNFVAKRHRYTDANHPDENATSGLSPYLHFGHISVFQVVQKLLEAEKWSPMALGEPKGARQGWWGVSEPVEAFLDQIVTWRELGFQEAEHNPTYQEYESLPEWAKATLAAHRDDARKTYTRMQLEDAQTDDDIWNAAQRQLRREGVIHNYLRMLWGKKILQWSKTPQEALATMLYLNDKYALDGRDPNSISGIFWVLGRYDRGWPEREIFGKVRCMTSDSTRRKLKLAGYLNQYGPDSESASFEK